MRELKLLTGKRVLVVTDDTAVDGVIESATRTAVTLLKCTVVSGPEPVEVEGYIIIPAARISYVRVP